VAKLDVAFPGLPHTHTYYFPPVLIILNNVNKKLFAPFFRHTAALIIFFCAFVSGGASAQTATKYLSYTTDINGDGQLDILVVPIPNVVMISLDDDMDIPIVLPPAIPSFLLLSSGNGGYQLSTDVGSVKSNPSWTQGLVNVTVNSGQSSSTPSITINYVTSSQLPSIVSKASDGTLVLTQSGSAPLANNVPYVEHMCRVP
jgi:hypothetical protein